MKMKPMSITFSKSPMKYIWFCHIFPMLPLMLKVKFAMFHFYWMDKKPKLLKKLFGKKYVSVKYVYREWTTITDSQGKYMMREIAYVYRRTRIPWALSKERRGIQLDQLEAPIFHTGDWDNVVSTMTRMREGVAMLNVALKRRREQVDAFKNPTPAYHLQ